MKTKPKIVIIDDDAVFIKMLIKILAKKSNVIAYNTSSANAVEEITKLRPDCTILDIMMPEIDGLTICKNLRSDTSLNTMKIIIVSGKAYEFDRKRALSFGADKYITKPVNPETIVDQILDVIHAKIKLGFWGVRGTIPVPGEKAIRYGGNTNCITMEFPKGEFFIFDAGTGIKALSDYLVSQNRTQINGKLFISHPHWDHINTLQFFAPFFTRGNEFEILGPNHGDISMREMISAQMEGVYFPIMMKYFSARVYFHDLKEEEFKINNIRICTILLNHPGQCLGYKIEYEGRTICYVTDNELYPQNSLYYDESKLLKLRRFVENANALITDSTYKDDEYEAKACWGHSSVSQVAEFAHEAKVKDLYLYHHDPDHTDDDIDDKLKTAVNFLTQKKSITKCFAPREGEFFKY